jgi:hypothetical protein
MSINSLSNKNAPNVVASASLQSNGATEVRKRKKWTMEMNIFIIREYFRITKLQDVVSTYRLDLFKAFQSKYPQFPVTIQNLADQRRAIMKKNYISSAILEKIKNDVKLELSINYSDNNEVINQSNHIQQSIIKENLEKQFYLRIKSILKSKLNGNNLIKAVNTYAVPLLTYSFGVIKWSKTTLQNINIKTRVLFTKFSKHHTKSAIERFNLPRENGGRGFSNLEILLKNQIASLKNYFLNRARDNTFFNALVSADKGYTPLNLSDNIISDIVKPNIPDTIANIKQKSLHGRYFKELEQPEVNIQASHAWLKKSNIHPETEGFIFAIQDRVINTRNYKKHICGLQSIIDKCRICGTEGETIEHIISSCTVLAQSEYKKRHDIFAKIIHMNLAVKFNLLKNTQPHYSYTPESCLENDSYKLYFDRTILTDIHIKHNRPDIIILNKQQKQAYLLDIAVPNSHNITQTYNTKINKYLEMSVAMRNLWCLEKISILLLVISARE